MKSTAGRPLAVAAGLTLDILFGEPPAPLHPVGLFGAAMGRLERSLWRDARSAGLVFAATGVVLGAGAGVVAEIAVGDAVASTLAVALASACRSLTDAAGAVAAALARGDLEAARAGLPALVGRDPDGLDEKEIARATVESLAENLSDAVVATVLWALLAGAPGALAHRAVNTLDAMVGYRSSRYRRFGWASARLDDVMGWPAARATAALVALVRPAKARSILAECRRVGTLHPSPNAGVAEAAFAVALDVRLGGVNRYGGRVEERPVVSAGAPPAPEDIERAIALVRQVAAVILVLLAAVTALERRAERRRAGGASR